MVKVYLCVILGIASSCWVGHSMLLNRGACGESLCLWYIAYCMASSGSEQSHGSFTKWPFNGDQSGNFTGISICMLNSLWQNMLNNKEVLELVSCWNEKRWLHEELTALGRQPFCVHEALWNEHFLSLSVHRKVFPNLMEWRTIGLFPLAQVVEFKRGRMTERGRQTDRHAHRLREREGGRKYTLTFVLHPFWLAWEN